MKNRSQKEIEKITRNPKSELLIIYAYQLPSILQKSKIRIERQFYGYLGIIGITWWKLEEKMYLQINCSSFETLLEFPFNLKTLKNYDYFTKTQLKNINPRLRYLKNTPVTYSNYYKELVRKSV